MPIKPENKARYPKDWRHISERIRRRAHGHCECLGECGVHHEPCRARNGWPNPRTGSTVVLTVAHLDHQPENCRDDNLKAMCQCCHLNYDLEHHRRTRQEAARCKNTMELPL